MLFCYCKQNAGTCTLTRSWNSVMSHSSVSRLVPCFSAAMYRRRFSCRIPGVMNMSRSFCHDCLSYTNQKDVFGTWRLVEAPLQIMSSLFMLWKAAMVFASQVTALGIIFSKNYILKFKSSRSTFSDTFHCNEDISKLIRLFFICMKNITSTILISECQKTEATKQHSARLKMTIALN